METSLPGSLGQRGFASDLRALWAVMRREWVIFTRYPSWVIALFIWPVIFPMLYILTARALAGPDGSGMTVFMEITGASDFIGYIVIGTTVWMWQNIVLRAFLCETSKCAAHWNPTGSLPHGDFPICSGIRVHRSSPCSCFSVLPLSSLG